MHRQDDHTAIRGPLRGAAALAALESEGKLFGYGQDVAAVLDRDPRTVYDSIRRGEIPHVKIGQRYMVSVAWMRRQVDGLDTPEQARSAESAAVAS